MEVHFRVAGTSEEEKRVRCDERLDSNSCCDCVSCVRGYEEMDDLIDYEIFDVSGGAFTVKVTQREAARLDNGMECDEVSFNEPNL